MSVTAAGLDGQSGSCGPLYLAARRSSGARSPRPFLLDPSPPISAASPPISAAGSPISAASPLISAAFLASFSADALSQLHQKYRTCADTDAEGAA